MKFSASLLLLSVLSGAAIAKNCAVNVYYCGFNLRKIATGNNYDNQITKAMAGHNGDSNNAVFLCLGGNNGDIRFVEQCGTCIDAGSGKSDYCT
ncbi:hypothetical protein BKA65DRAFT_521449 [Rhexocercosporidium sp. MPI-PUGE-AT-0058]|nr:hypothetical protein BKA65DRAFT_521449 [Rhexocercosporidium sp. MPI-PUGE-AT-0058]